MFEDIKTNLKKKLDLYQAIRRLQLENKIGPKKHSVIHLINLLLTQLTRHLIIISSYIVVLLINHSKSVTQEIQVQTIYFTLTKKHTLEFLNYGTFCNNNLYSHRNFFTNFSSGFQNFSPIVKYALIPFSGKSFMKSTDKIGDK